LSLKEQAFVRELPLAGWIAEKAAIAAGYSVHRARKTGNELLRRPEVVKAVLAMCHELEARAEIKADQIVAADLEMALGDISDVAECDGRELKPKAWKDMAPRYRRLIQSIQQDERGNWKIRLHSVHPARDRLYKHFGLFGADHKQQAEAFATMMEKVNAEDRAKVKDLALAVLGAGDGHR
jgi:hypothetical protein